MQLTDEQKQKVATWIADGMKLSDIQARLGEEFDLRTMLGDLEKMYDELDPPLVLAPSPDTPSRTRARLKRARIVYQQGPLSRSRPSPSLAVRK